MRHEESRIQQACVRWFRYAYPSLAKLLFAVPNGGSRNVIEASRLKAEGVLSGVADLLLLVPNKEYHALCVEMKTATGRQKPTQKEWQSEVESHGYKYVVCKSFDEFRFQVSQYLLSLSSEQL